jgi:hypothetical protein
VWARASRVGEAPAVQPVAEIVLFGGDLKEVSWRNGKMPEPGTKLYAAIPPGTSNETKGPDGVLEVPRG